MPFTTRPASLLAAILLALALWLAMGSGALRAQPADIGLGGSDEDGAPLQILTSDLARVQTINAPQVVVTFVIIGKQAIARVLINGEEEPVADDTVVVVNRTFRLDTPETLIEVAAVDRQGNRREKSFMVLREVFERSYSWEERRDAILALIEAERYADARVELGLWESLRDHPEAVEELWRLLDDRATAEQQAEIQDLIRTDRFDEALAQIKALRRITARPVVANTLLSTLARRKRSVLRAEIEVLVVQRDFDESKRLLDDWDTAGDSPDMVASLRSVWRAWRDSPQQAIELRDLHANSLVYLQARKLTAGPDGWEPSQAILQADPQLVGAGSGRYNLPGPGEYRLLITHEGMHEPWQTTIATNADGTLQTFDPDLTYLLANYRWLDRPPLPLPRAGAGLMRDGATLQLVGGYQELRYDRTQAEDIYLAPQDNSVYAGLDAVEVYNTALLDWDAPLVERDAPERGFLFTPVQVGGQRFVVAGTGKVWEVPADWSVWREVEGPLPAVFGRPTATAYGGKLYVFGGLAIEPLPSESQDVIPVPTRSAFAYDPRSGEWQTLAPLPRALGAATAATVGDRIYVIGGTDGKDYLDTVFAYVPDTDTWQPQAVMPTPRAYAGSAVVNGRIYVLGGEGSGFFGTSVLESVESFDPAGNTWSEAPSLPVARKDPSVAVVAGGIYVMGGFDESPLTAFDLYATPAHLTPPRELPETSPFGSRLRRRRATGGKSADMVRIPGGSFVMGREAFLGSSETEPEHEVRLSPFLLDDSEVNQEDFALIMGFNPSSRKGPFLPVESVTWFQAKQYCEKIGKRLPTEAEWEFAAKSGRDTRYYFGESNASAPRYENFCGGVCQVGGTITTEVFGEEDGAVETGRVRNYYPSAYGLFDMLGNVSEWVADWYGPYEDGAADNPLGPVSGETKAYRGGNYRDLVTLVRPTDREELDPAESLDTLGFRCAADVKAEGDK